MSDDRIPDVAEPIVGYRVWRFTPQSPQLRSSFVDLVWPKGGLVAQCLIQHAGSWLGPWTPDSKMPKACKTTPNKDCKSLHPCGIYAYREFGDLLEDGLLRAGPVFGEVRLWGQVQPYAKGYRASHAEIAALYDTLPLEAVGAGAWGYSPPPVPEDMTALETLRQERIAQSAQYYGAPFVHREI